MSHRYLCPREPDHNFEITVTHPHNGDVYHVFYQQLYYVVRAMNEIPVEWRPSVICLNEEALKGILQW